MASFVVDLWESVFQPGTTPALIIATHASFCLLVISMVTMIFVSGSIHFVNLSIISICLWAAVTWFIAELEKEKAKLKSNEELSGETDADTSAEKKHENKKEK